jgi:hypothetical protein
MTSIEVRRIKSQTIGPVTRRWSEGGRPTERWQDKSREVCGHRSVGSGANSGHFARCARPRDGLHNRARPWTCTRQCTSRHSGP